MSEFKHSGERGQVLPLIGLAMAVIIGFGAVAVDIGTLDYNWERQQNAADSAALSGARQLLNGTCPSQVNAQNAADQDAATNGFTGSPQVSVVVNNPPLAGPYSVAGGNTAASANCSVAVTITVPEQTYFLGWMGYALGFPQSTQAVAQMQNTNPGCVYLLSPTNASTFASTTFTASSCGILINDTASFASATVTAKQIGYAGSSLNTSGAKFPSATPTPMLSTQDPCPEIAGCNQIAQSPPSTSGCTALTQNGGTISPQCYSSLNLTGAVTLNPGTYVLNGTTSFGAGGVATSLTGSGVTFYVPASTAGNTVTPPNFTTAAAGGTLTPPSSGTLTGVLYYQAPANTTAPAFGGTGPTMSGLIYAPGAQNVPYNNGTKYVVLVFGSGNFTGGNTTIASPVSPFTQLVDQVVLVQ